MKELRGLEGRSAGAGSVHSAERRAECPPHGEPRDRSLEVSSEVSSFTLPSCVLFLRNKEDGETGSD